MKMQNKIEWGLFMVYGTPLRTCYSCFECMNCYRGEEKNGIAPSKFRDYLVRRLGNEAAEELKGKWFSDDWQKYATEIFQHRGLTFKKINTDEGEPKYYKTFTDGVHCPYPDEVGYAYVLVSSPYNRPTERADTIISTDLAIQLLLDKYSEAETHKLTHLWVKNYSMEYGEIISSHGGLAPWRGTGYGAMEVFYYSYADGFACDLPIEVQEAYILAGSPFN